MSDVRAALAYWMVDSPKDDLWLGRSVASLAVTGLALLATVMVNQAFSFLVIWSFTSAAFCMVKSARIQDASSQ